MHEKQNGAVVIASAVGCQVGKKWISFWGYVQYFLSHGNYFLAYGHNATKPGLSKMMSFKWPFFCLWPKWRQFSSYEFIYIPLHIL